MTTTSAPASAPSRTRPAKAVRSFLFSRTVVLTTASLLLVVYFDQASGGLFLTTTNASLLLRQAAVIAVIAAGVAVLIIMGEIDLSIGSAVFITGLVAAQCQVAGWDLVSSALAAVAAGVAIGLVQGLVVVRVGVASFVVTLAGLLVWRGVGLTWTDAAAIGPVSPGFTSLTEGRLPTWFVWVAVTGVVASGVAMSARALRRPNDVGVQARVVATSRPLVGSLLIAAALLWVMSGRQGVPSALLWISAVGLGLVVLMRWGVFGRRTFLIGSSREAANYAGVSAGRTVLWGFVIMGAIYGIAGTMLTARLSTSTPDAGVSLELVAIAAAVIGGNSLRGGRGSIQGAILGAFLLATIDNGMALLGVSSYAQSVVKGLILVVAVGVDGIVTRRRGDAAA